MATQNLLTTLNQSGGKAMVEEYIRKSLLERPMREGVFNKAAYGMVLGLPTESGQYMKLTQTKGMRRPRKMPDPGGAGSDPASPGTTGVNQMNVPMEYLQDYFEIAKTMEQTSWIDFRNVMKEGMSDALGLRCHELVQNAMVVGRYEPGDYDAAGAISTEFDQTVEATVSLYGNSFTFKSCPKVYAGGAADFNTLVADGTRANFTDIFQIATRLKLSGAPTINGKYVCVLSQSMMDDMLVDPDLDNRIAQSLIASGSKPRKGMEDGWLGEYGSVMFMEDTWAYTEDATEGAENKRAEFGSVHTAFMFGKEAFGYLRLGGQDGAKMPTPKIQDLTKTGYSTSVGYLVPWQAATVNSNFGCCYKALVSTAKPNGYSDTNKQLPFGGESIGD